MTADRAIALLEAIVQLAGLAAGLVEDVGTVMASEDRAVIEAKLQAIAAANDALAARLATRLAGAAS